MDLANKFLARMGIWHCFGTDTRFAAMPAGSRLPAGAAKGYPRATMTTPGGKVLHYRRSHFVTQLPMDYRYTPSHAWIANQQADVWRVGLTRFATRMLGDMVDHGFEVEPDTMVELGQVVGWVEGFKAISDLFCVVRGRFAGANPLLKEKIVAINKDCYGSGWLYEVHGGPDPKCMDVNSYRDLLDKTIDRLLAQRKGEEIK